MTEYFDYSSNIFQACFMLKKSTINLIISIMFIIKKMYFKIKYCLRISVCFVFYLKYLTGQNFSHLPKIYRLFCPKNANFSQKNLGQNY